MLNQSDMIVRVGERFGIKECNTVNTPIEAKLDLSKMNGDMSKTSKPYRQLIGCLSYISAATRPNINYSINFFSRYKESATDEHFGYLMRVLKYLLSTEECKLVFGYGSNDQAEDLVTYADADWVADSNDRKSTSGLIC